MRRALVLLVLFGAVAAVGLAPTLAGAFNCTTPAADTGDMTVGPVWLTPPSTSLGSGDVGAAVGPVSAEGDGTANPPSGYLSVKVADAGFTITGAVGLQPPQVCTDTSP